MRAVLSGRAPSISSGLAISIIVSCVAGEGDDAVFTAGLRKINGLKVNSRNTIGQAMGFFKGQ